MRRRDGAPWAAWVCVTRTTYSIGVTPTDFGSHPQRGHRMPTPAVNSLPHEGQRIPSILPREQVLDRADGLTRRAVLFRQRLLRLLERDRLLEAEGRLILVVDRAIRVPGGDQV